SLSLSHSQRSHSNPSAVYSCSLCEVLLDSVSDAHRHIKDKWHKRRAKERCEEEMLTEIAPPRAEQVAAVGMALEGVVRERGMSDQDVENRQKIVSNMQEVLTAVLPEVKLRLYGSSCTKFGFKDSDVNIDIQFPPHMHQPDVLLLVQKSLSNLSDGCCCCRPSGLVCKVSAGNDNACLTTSFLFELSSREPLLLPLVLGFRHWAWICHVDRAEEGGLPSYVLALMVIYFLQQRKRPVLPAYLGHEIKDFSISRLHDFSLTYMEDGCVHWGYYPVSKDSSSPPETIFREGKAPLVFQSAVSPPSVGLLWVEMLRFYSLEFNMTECVISVRTSLVLSRDAKDWPKKRIAVEDPFAVKRNVARTLNSQQMYEYILHCLKSTYKYFALPLSLPSANHKMAGPRGANYKRQKALSDVSRVQSGLSSLKLESQAANGQKGEAGFKQDSDCMVEEEEESPSDSDNEGEKEDEDLGKNSLSEEEEEDEELDEEDVLDNKTEGASVVCSVCKRDGHLKKDCPEDFQRVQLAPLPPMTPAFLKTLNTVCQQCYRDFAPDDVELGVREHILQDLESFVKRQFTGARLRLFGSSKNGFGFKQSDLDICMVLDGQETAEGLDCISIIESLARLLRKHPGLRNILPITTAKVPIVKFYHARTGLEGDISLYNTLVRGTHTWLVMWEQEAVTEPFLKNKSFSLLAIRPYTTHVCWLRTLPSTSESRCCVMSRRCLPRYVPPVYS
uniref:Terminal uridylyl transferase 7 n=1 Tax=Oncorhynchus kisutch TaxID=8019 RepID=A0A8C7FSZ8_ONCKI